MAEEDTQEATANPAAEEGGATEAAAESTSVPEEGNQTSSGDSSPDSAQNNIDFLLDVPVKLTAELGSCKMTMQELLDLGLGTVVQLDQPANANVDLFVNQKLVARGEVVVAEDNFGIRIKEIVSKP
tara:strand:+ start:534 stop:914 length:381 start_codon:yes stop_codon:yes gene_type:complete